MHIHWSVALLRSSSGRFGSGACAVVLAGPHRLIETVIYRVSKIHRDVTTGANIPFFGLRQVKRRKIGYVADFVLLPIKAWAPESRAPFLLE